MDKIKEYKPALEQNKAFAPDIIPGLNAPLINAPSSVKNYQESNQLFWTESNVSNHPLKWEPKSITLYANSTSGDTRSILTWVPAWSSRITFRNSPVSVDSSAVQGESFTISRYNGKHVLNVTNPNAVQLIFYIYF